MQDDIVIRINKAYPSIRVDEIIDGVITTKEVSQQDLLDCFKASNIEGITTGLLPKGCIAYSKASNNIISIVLESDLTKADITYAGTTYKDFPLPRLVFYMSFEKGCRVRNVGVGVIEKRRITPKTKMYYYPFSNVGNDGAMCTGGNVLPKCENAYTLESVPLLLMEYPNGDHHFSSKHNKLGLSFRDLLEYMKDKTVDTYYTDILIEKNKTLNEFIKEIM